MDNSIVKAELLWTRKCPLSCHYCSMVTGEEHSRDLEFWKKGLDNLKDLDCKFIAIYGAEPLHDFDGLPEFVTEATNRGIDLTVITSGVAKHTHEKLQKLYNAGLRSLTMSYDIVPLDNSSKAKSGQALGLLEYFRGLGPVDNVAIVVTLTRTNYKGLYETAKLMTEMGIWTFFDIYHYDRGQQGSKVKGKDEELMFREEDVPLLIEELKKMQKGKADGLMVHASEEFLKYLIDNPKSIINYDWNCGKWKNEFPSWVTVNCDGLVYPCDDFQFPGTGIPLDILSSNIELAKEMWGKSVCDHCSGCLWNTHLDAHFIKRGTASIDGYVHKGK